MPSQRAALWESGSTTADGQAGWCMVPGPHHLGGRPMLVLRDVQKTDLPGLKRLAAVLNTVNLPNNEETLDGHHRQVGEELRRTR